MSRKNTIKILALTGILAAGLFLFSGSFDKQGLIVRAEEEDEGEDREDSEERAPQIPAEQPKETKQTAPKTEYKTIYRQLPATTVETPVTTVRHDSDSDGLYDDEDAHPTINDYFIVKDDNLDGIDDRYEAEQSLLGKN